MTNAGKKIFLVGVAAILLFSAWMLRPGGRASQPLDNGTKTEEVVVTQESEETENLPLSVYPQEYFLLPEEVPSGFELGTIGEEAQMLGFTSNPGPLANTSLYRLFYGNPDDVRIESAHVAAYVKPEALRKELGMFLVRYKSPEDFEAELPKIASTPAGSYPAGPLYLRDSLVLVIIWSDTKAYIPAMEEVAQKLQERLHLTRP